MDKTKWWQTAQAKKVGKWALAVAVLGLVLWFFMIFPYVSTDDARVAADLYKIAPDGVNARTIAVNVTEGDPVRKDQVLVELDHTMAKGAFDKAKAHADLSQRDFDRMNQLYQSKSIPQKDFDFAKSNNETAKAELAMAQEHLDNTYLRSPVDGVVVQKMAEVGNILEQGQTAVTVADVEHAWISANIEETSIGSVKPGQVTKISVDEGGTLKGKVLEVRHATAATFSLIPSDSGSGNFTKVVQRIPIKIQLEPHDAQSLRVGQSVEIKIRVR
jgi:membrane fusion protein (multidrug efflux system)